MFAPGYTVFPLIKEPGVALVSCPECSRSVSDAALNCPKCGYPIKRHHSPDASLTVDDTNGDTRWPWFDCAMFCGSLALLAFGLSAIAGRFMAGDLVKVLVSLAILLVLAALALAAYAFVDSLWRSAGKRESHFIRLRRITKVLGALGGVMWSVGLIMLYFEPGFMPRSTPARYVQSADGSVRIGLADAWKQVDSAHGVLLLAETPDSFLSIKREPYKRENDTYLTIHAENIARSIREPWQSLAWRHAKLEPIRNMPAAWIEMRGEIPSQNERNRMLLVLVHARDARYQIRFVVPENKWEHLRQSGIDMVHTIQLP